METITLTIRITPELKRQIEIIAKNEDRSIVKVIVSIYLPP